jgi:hypothetical protein
MMNRMFGRVAAFAGVAKAIQTETQIGSVFMTGNISQIAIEVKKSLLGSSVGRGDPMEL